MHRKETEMLTSTTDSMNAEIAYRQQRISAEFRRANGRETRKHDKHEKHGSGLRRLLSLRPAA
jgi:hypothetical protein